MKKALLLLAAFCLMAVSAMATDYMVSWEDPNDLPSNAFQPDTMVLVPVVYLQAYQDKYPAQFVASIDFDCSENPEKIVTATIDLEKEVVEDQTQPNGKRVDNLVVLRIHGSGATKNYEDGGGTNPVPWIHWAIYIQKVVVESGVTGIGTNFFRDLTYSDGTDAEVRPNFPISLPSSLTFFSSSARPDKYAGNLYCHATTPPQSDWVEVNPRPDYFNYATVYVPDAYVDVYSSQTLYKGADFWQNFAMDRMIKSNDMVAPVVPQDLVYNTGASIRFDIVQEATKYYVTIEFENTLFRKLLITSDGTGGWSLTDITDASPLPGRRFLPVLRRDTVKGTVETLQIDITGLGSGKSYNFTVTATKEDNTEVSKRSGCFTTTTEKETPTGIDEIVADEQIIDNRYYNILGQPVAPDYRGIIIHNGKKILRD